MKKITLNILSTILFVSHCSLLFASNISFREVGKVQTKSTILMKSTDSKEVLNVESRAIITKEDIKSIESKTQAGICSVSFTLSKSGAEKLRYFSKSHLGNNVAIVVDENIVAAPKISTAIIGNKFVVDSITQTDADILVKRFKATN